MREGRLHHYHHHHCTTRPLPLLIITYDLILLCLHSTSWGPELYKDMSRASRQRSATRAAIPTSEGRFSSTRIYTSRMARMYLYSIFTYTPVRPLSLQASVGYLHRIKSIFEHFVLHAPVLFVSITCTYHSPGALEGSGPIALTQILQLVRPTCSPIRATALEQRCIPMRAKVSDWLMATRREVQEEVSCAGLGHECMDSCMSAGEGSEWLGNQGWFLLNGMCFEKACTRADGAIAPLKGLLRYAQ
jgi:hypothetical protein